MPEQFEGFVYIAKNGESADGAPKRDLTLEEYDALTDFAREVAEQSNVYRPVGPKAEKAWKAASAKRVERQATDLHDRLKAQGQDAKDIKAAVDEFHAMDAESQKNRRELWARLSAPVAPVP